MADNAQRAKGMRSGLERLFRVVAEGAFEREAIASGDPILEISFPGPAGAGASAPMERVAVEMIRYQAELGAPQAQLVVRGPSGLRATASTWLRLLRGFLVIYQSPGPWDGPIQIISQAVAESPQGPCGATPEALWQPEALNKILTPREGWRDRYDVWCQGRLILTFAVWVLDETTFILEVNGERRAIHSRLRGALVDAVATRIRSGPPCYIQRKSIELGHS